jgi:hypothetical protein
MSVWKCSKVVWQHPPKDNFSENREPSTSLEEKFVVVSLPKVDHSFCEKLRGFIVTCEGQPYSHEFQRG